VIGSRGLAPSPGARLAAAALILAVGPASARGASRPAASPMTTAAVIPESPVAGESWVRHLHLSIENTAFGATGGWGGPFDSPPEPPASPVPTLAGPVRATGRDIYRLSCRSCHRGDGGGAPPEILPMTSLVRATSAALFRRKLKERGLPVDEAALARNAAEAETSLRKRIREGGEKMPPSPQLGPGETESLIAYLKEVAGVPAPSPAPAPIRESVFRVGELVVKGTCHVCHDATPATAPGYRPGDGSPPPLSVIVEKRTCAQLIRKVREGLAEPSISAAHGRIPVFDYLSPQEVTAAYVYLLLEPPTAAPLDTMSPAPPPDGRRRGNVQTGSRR